MWFSGKLCIVYIAHSSRLLDPNSIHCNSIMMVTEGYAHYALFGEDHLFAPFPPTSHIQCKNHFWSLPADWIGSCHLVQIVNHYPVFNSSSFCQYLATTLQTNHWFQLSSFPPESDCPAPRPPHNPYARIWGPL